MKKSQVTIIVIVGIILLIIVGFFLFAVSNRQSAELEEESGESASFSLEKESFQQYFDQCARNAVIYANEEYGLKDNYEYRTYISEKVVYCMSDFLSDLRKKGFSVSTYKINTETKVFSKTISVNIEYPITVSYKEDSFSFEDYRVSFDRESSVSIINIDDEEVILRSTDRNVNIIIPKGTEVVDRDGNPITSLTIKVLDKHSGGMDNNVVVGNLLYDALPPVTFSKPAQISIDYRTLDVPLNNPENSLSIAWWDEEYGIWRGLDTKVEKGVATADVSHFTKFAIVRGCSDVGEYEVSKFISGLYSQQYDDGKVWIKSEEGQIYTSGEVEEELQLLGDEKIVFGPDNVPDDKYCDGFIETECCCYGQDEINGTTYRTGCLSLPLRTCSGEIASLSELYYQGDIDSCNKEVKGYDDYECLGGRIIDKDGDGAIFKVVFEENGNSCIKSFKIDTYPSPGTECVVEPESGDEVGIDKFTGKPAININELEVLRTEEPDKGEVETTTNCTIKITLEGVGANVQISDVLEYDLERECTKEGEYGYLEVEGISTCAICEEDEFGQLYYRPTDIEECCGPDNELVGYCPGVKGEEGKICVDGVFKDWENPDPRCDWCCTDACKFGSSECPYTEDECSIVTCVD